MATNRCKPLTGERAGDLDRLAPVLPHGIPRAVLGQLVEPGQPLQRDQARLSVRDEAVEEHLDAKAGGGHPGEMGSKVIAEVRPLAGEPREDAAR